MTRQQWEEHSDYRIITDYEEHNCKGCILSSFDYEINEIFCLNMEELGLSHTDSIVDNEHVCNKTPPQRYPSWCPHWGRG